MTQLIFDKIRSFKQEELTGKVIIDYFKVNRDDFRRFNFDMGKSFSPLMLLRKGFFEGQGVIDKAKIEIVPTY